MASIASRADRHARRFSGQLVHSARSGHLIALSLTGASLVYLIGSRNLWFFGDEWAFIAGRRALWADGDRFAYLFNAHNEHLSTIPVIVNGAIFSLVVLNSYVAYMMPVIAAHTAVCLLSWRLMLRLGSPPTNRCATHTWHEWPLRRIESRPLRSTRQAVCRGMVFSRADVIGAGHHDGAQWVRSLRTARR